MSSTPASTASASTGFHRASWTDRARLILSRLDLTSPLATYVIRAIVAGWLALGLAYVLELDMPFSAATTVLLVVNPIQGAVIGKGAWRVLGTLIGMIASVLLMAAFADMPWLFVIGFSVWLGVCVGIMTMLRHFRASGIAVAGYTVGLATLGALERPHLTFEHVVGRGSTVMLGVISLSLVSALFSTRSIRGKLEGLLARLTSRAAHTLAVSCETGPGAADVVTSRRQLIAEIYGVDDLLAAGKAESADLAHRAHAVRHAMASLFSALAGGLAPTAQDPADEPLPAQLRQMLTSAWREAAQAVDRGPDGFQRAADVMRLARERLADGLGAGTAMSPAAVIAIDRLIEQIDDYLAALDGLASLRRTRPGRASSPVRFHRDTRAAWHNGVRAALTLFTAGALWIVTGWPHGDMMLLIVSPYCALLATSPNPVAGSWQFVKGTLFALPAAFVCAFGILPHIEGLPLLLVVLALFWLPGLIATTMPQHGLAALAYFAGFNTLTAAANPMHYDLRLFLNWSVAWVLGTLVAWMGFRLFMPRNLPRDIERLRGQIRDATLRVLRAQTLSAAPDHLAAVARVWQWRQQHRIAHLGALLKATSAAPDATQREVADALASLRLGRDIVRLQAWRQQHAGDAQRAQAHTIVSIALDRMAHRMYRKYRLDAGRGAPTLAALHARRAVRRLARLRTSHINVGSGGSGGAEQTMDLTRLVAAFSDIAVLLESHAAYFARSSTRPSLHLSHLSHPSHAH